MQGALRAAIDTLYPPRCFGCGAFGPLLCETCEAGLSPADGGSRCKNCAARWEDENNCPLCHRWVRSLDGGFAAFDMEGAARRVVHGLKYRGVRELAPLMAAAMAPLGQRVPFDGALAIPLHRSRLRDRGFNQAELLLENLGWQPCEGRLIRHKKTETQVGMHEHERRRNVDDAFAYEGPRLDGRSLALVDDVITTGSTAVECGRVLREHGARHVYIFAYTRANFRPGSRPDD